MKDDLIRTLSPSHYKDWDAKGNTKIIDKKNHTTRTFLNNLLNRT